MISSTIYRTKTQTNKPEIGPSLAIEELLTTIFYCSEFKNKLKNQTNMNTDVICVLRYCCRFFLQRC